MASAQPWPRSLRCLDKPSAVDPKTSPLRILVVSDRRLGGPGRSFALGLVAATWLRQETHHGDAQTVEDQAAR